MNTLISRSTTLVYKKAVKPLLFTQQPDKVHEHLLSSGSKLQRVSPLRQVINKSWAYKNPALSQNVFGLDFLNPVGLSAGFDKNFELPPILKSVGFGFMEGGSLTYKPYEGNPRPWFTRLPKSKSIVVYAGLANQGVENIIKRLEGYPSNVFKNFPLNISVAKTNSPSTCSDQSAIDDYVGSLTLLQKRGIGDLYTLNISCPNVYGGEPFTTKERLEKLLSAVDKLALERPMLIKMPSDLSWKAFDSLLSVAVKHHVAGVTISNLAKDRGQAKLMDPLPDSVKGNLSGKPVWELSNNLIKKTYQKYGDRLVIIGVGGIFSAEDAYTKIRLGATLVELITGLIFEGPQLIGQINEGLVRLIKQDGFTHISQAIGVDARRS